MDDEMQDQRTQVGTCSCGGPVLMTARQARAARAFGIGVDRDGKPSWEEACDPCRAAQSARYREDEAAAEARRLASVVRSRMTESQMPEELLGERVPGAEAGDPKPEREARLSAIRWARDTDASPFLLLWGDKGRGKTVLAAAAFAYALRRRPGYWVRSVELLRDLYGEYESPERAKAEHVARGRTMVVLDDLDKVMGERSGEQLFNVVDALYSRRTPTIVTMNGTPDEAAKRWGSMGPMIADRLAAFERAQFRGPSHRRRAA